MFPLRLQWLVPAALALGLTTQAWGVSPVGSEIRVDVDPKTSFYGVGRHYIARTADGGFAVLWESDTQDNGFFNFEAIRYRVFKANRKPVGKPRSLDVSKLRPLLAGVTIMPLGADKAYAVFTGSDKTTGEELALGQAIALKDGSPAAAKELCRIESGTTIGARAAALKDGRAAFACFGFYNPADYSDIPGRFIAKSGKPGPANLQFALDKESMLSALSTLGSGLLAYYPRTSLFNNTYDTFGRVFKADGKPLGPARKLPKAPSLTQLTTLLALSNNRILVRRFEKSGNTYKLTGQIFDDKWKSVVAKKTMLSQKGQYPGAAAFALRDGGFLLWERSGSGADAKHAITRFNRQLGKVGKTYTFKAVDGDIGRAAAIDASNWIAVYRKVVGGRERLVAQRLQN